MKAWKYILGILVLVAGAIWLAFFSSPDNDLHLIACDVGQGDAILIIQGKTQVLTDGGPNNKVLDCLAKYIPYGDREIEAVILTHPELDHYGGLIEVLKRYKVDNFFTNGLDSSSSGYEVLKNAVGGGGLKVTNLKKGMVVSIGLISLDILNPEELDEQTEKQNTNDQGIVSLLKFTDFKAVLTADVGKEKLLEIIKGESFGPVKYIKISHHGSKNNTSLELLDLLQPRLAVISVGRNYYGHPNQEVIDILNNKGIQIFRTDEKGDIEIITDGKTWQVK